MATGANHVRGVYPKSMMETFIPSTKAPSLMDEPNLAKIAPRRGLGCAGNESSTVSSLTTSYESEKETLGTVVPPATFIGHLSNIKNLLRNLTSYRLLIIYDATHRDLPTLTFHAGALYKVITLSDFAIAAIAAMTIFARAKTN